MESLEIKTKVGRKLVWTFDIGRRIPNPYRTKVYSGWLIKRELHSYYKKYETIEEARRRHSEIVEDLAKHSYSRRLRNYLNFFHRS